MLTRRARTAVLVSGGGTNLQALLDAARVGRLPSAELALVVSSRADAYALERAKAAGIPSCIAAKPKGEDLESYGERLLAALRAHGIDLVVLAGFLVILPANVVRAFPGRILNVHPSLIPAFCGKGFYGLRVHEAALARGVKVTGATVHVVNEIPDGGPILLQKAVAVEDGDTPEILQRRVMEQAEWVLLPRAVEETARKILAKEA
ncbi:MAG: phosphoribosylglycinamide formyltransferase [Kiritimatiellae bacterium]|nr:phosphoribosylglycinamide formyltransferase [Kiritimatiellia bacterium]